MITLHQDFTSKITSLVHYWLARPDYWGWPILPTASLLLLFNFEIRVRWLPQTVVRKG